MRALAAAALALAVALPAAAQRGGGHAGFSGGSAPAVRSAPSFRGSFGPSPAYRYNSGRAPAAYPSGMRVLSPPVRYPVGAPVHRPGFYQPNHGGPLNGIHRFHNRTYPYVNFGFYPGAVLLPYSGLLDDSFDDYDTSQQPAPQPGYDDNNPPDYNYVSPQAPPPPDGSYAYPEAPPPPDGNYAYPQPAAPPGYSYAYPQPMPEYAQPAPTPPQMQYVPGSSDTVTLIFKDGRPPEQIRNYLATRTTLTILDNGHRREVALADLDLPATIKANQQTGVDFELPSPVR